MTRLLVKYPIDLTGENPNNLVSSEKHVLTDPAQGDLRVLAPQQGSFYSRSLKVYDGNGRLLSPHLDYVATFLYQDATERTGLEVCGAVIIKNPAVTPTVYLDYQCVGGDYAVSVDTLRQVIDALAEDDRTVTWGNIVGKPTEFPPGEHPHALWHLYGFEPVVVELERIYSAIIAGDQAALDEIKRYAKALFDDAQKDRDELRRDVNVHLADYQNPHRVTKAQTGLGNVPNYTTSSQREAEEGTRDDRFMTPQRTAQAIKYQVVPILQRHIDDKGNPHGVTKAQVGLPVVENLPLASRTQATQGTSHATYMTPLRTAEAIEVQVVPILQRHIDNKSNPHSVTKSQIGLGQVDNYPTASDAIAVGKGSTRHFVTPANLAAVLAAHNMSGNHDHRYIIRNGEFDGDIRVAGGRAYVRISGDWKQIWPAQWA